MGREANKQIVRRYRVALNANQLQPLEDLVAADLITHGFPVGLPPGLTAGTLLHQVAIAAFPDLQVTTDDLIAEGDRVVERWTRTGTHTGASFMGVSASGRTFSVTGISIYRIAGDRIAEHWGETDTLDLLQQLGLPCTPEEPAVQYLGNNIGRNYNERLATHLPAAHTRGSASDRYAGRDRRGGDKPRSPV